MGEDRWTCLQRTVTLLLVLRQKILPAVKTKWFLSSFLTSSVHSKPELVGRVCLALYTLVDGSIDTPLAIRVDRHVRYLQEGETAS